MLPNIKISSKYADALFSASVADKSVNSIKKDLELFQEVLPQYKEFFKFLNGPVHGVNTIVEFMESISKKCKLHDKTIRLLSIIARHRRLNLLSSIIDLYLAKCREMDNKKLIEVRSFSKLSKAQIGELEGALKKKLDKEIIINNIIDESILGGIVIKCDSFVIDDSILNKLNNVRLLTNKILI